MRAPSRVSLRHRLTLQAPAETPDLAGGVIRQWTDVSALWAAVAPRDAGSVLVGDAPASLATHDVTIRWRKGVTAAQRLVGGARVFMIRGVVDPDETRRWLVLKAEETGA